MSDIDRPKQFTVVKDSGSREEFATGSVRDDATGKGRYDLITPIGLRALAAASAHISIHNASTARYVLNLAVLAVMDLEIALAAAWLAQAIQLEETNEPFDCDPLMLTGQCRTLQFQNIPPRAIHRLAVHYENGARKYGDRNWEKGQPVSRFIQSGTRHLFNHIGGDRSEDHLAAALWNVLGAIHVKYKCQAGELPSECNDLALAGEEVEP